MGQSGEPLDDAHELLDAHVGVLDGATVEHGRPHPSSLAVDLGAVKNPENDALLAGEAVASIGDLVEHDREDSIPDGRAQKRKYPETSVDGHDRRAIALGLIAPYQQRRCFLGHRLDELHRDLDGLVGRLWYRLHACSLTLSARLWRRKRSL